MNLYPEEIAVMSKAKNGKATTAEPGEIRTWRGLCEAGLAYETTRRVGKFRDFKIGPTAAEMLAAQMERS